MRLFALFNIILVALTQIVKANYTLQTEYSGKSFFEKVNFYSGKDPLGGYVKYQDSASATSLGLAYVNDKNRVILKSNNANVTSGGRPSIRVHSKEVYNGGLFLFDINHMPQGCGTWAAYWMVGPSWPNNGEIDVSFSHEKKKLINYENDLFFCLDFRRCQYAIYEWYDNLYSQRVYNGRHKPVNDRHSI